jgi:hypothetical protein
MKKENVEKRRAKLESYLNDSFLIDVFFSLNLFLEKWVIRGFFKYQGVFKKFRRN